MKYRFSLQPYKGIKTRYNCPKCLNTKRTFTRYIDTQTGEHIAPGVGKCNRELKCGYHYTPKQYFKDNAILPHQNNYKRDFNSQLLKPIIEPIDYIPFTVFKRSLQPNLDTLQLAETNCFIKFLLNNYGVTIATELISKYYISTSKYWKGATVFWQVDITGKVRTGKIMLYNSITGKRIKEPFIHINWVHAVKKEKEQDYKLQQCFFGEHLLKSSKPVAIVESEKTAIISSVYMPQFIWLAAGSLNNLTAERCNVLKGRTVIFYPDIGVFEKWNLKIKEFSDLGNFSISNLLEINAAKFKLENGSDIADIIIRNIKPI